MKNKIICIILVLFLFSVSSLSAQGLIEKGTDFKKGGQSTMTFLQVSVVPEAVALGEAYSSVGTGVQSMFYNPAGLVEMDTKFEVFVSNLQWIADINYYAGGAAWNLNQYGTVGISFLTIDYGDIIETQLLPYDQFEQNPIGYIETGKMVDNVGAYAFGVMYSYKVSNLFSMGLGVKYASQQLGQGVINGESRTADESKFAFDLGVKYYTPIKSLRFGMSFRNFSTSAKFEEETYPLPYQFSVGAALDLVTLLLPSYTEDHSLLTSMEFSHPNNYTERLHMGIEYTIIKTLALRAGYMTNHDINGLSLGVGLNANISGTSTKISYTYSSMDVFDDVNRFSLMFAF